MPEFQNASRSAKTSGPTDVRGPQLSSRQSQKYRFKQPSMEGLRFADQSQIPLTREEAEAKQAGQKVGAVSEGKLQEGQALERRFSINYAAPAWLRLRSAN